MGKILKIRELGGGDEFVKTFFPNEPNFKMAFKRLTRMNTNKHGFKMGNSIRALRQHRPAGMGSLMRMANSVGLEEFLRPPRVSRWGAGIFYKIGAEFRLFLCPRAASW
jgi:hypothetical protein